MPRKAKIEMQDVKDLFGRAWSGRSWITIYGVPVRVTKGRYKGKFYVTNHRGKRWVAAHYDIRPLGDGIEAWKEYIDSVIEAHGEEGIVGLHPDKDDIKTKRRRR